ncbi:MAG: ABC transporter ATP-binding protein [Sphaerochaetaceae bacterium]|nr:ABC transporter ATP-binding protein [Sphaerochaetaceae bacterium]
MPESALVCSNLEVAYPEFTLSLDFSISEGELVSIIGPSGCGKSTTLQLITGLLKCEKGTIRLYGRDIANVPIWDRQIAMVFQDYALFPHLNVEQNIAYSLKIKHIGRKERLQTTRSLMELVGLEGYAKRNIAQLSGGEKQRVALARALASKPKLLLLDEPLSALDAKLRKHLRQEIRNIHDTTGITTLYVTHDQEEALTLSDRVLVMNNGRMEQLDTPEHVYAKPSTVFAAKFMGEGTLLPYDVIPTILVSTDKGPDKVVFRSGGENRQIFFRPERVIVHDNPELAFPEFLPHLRFNSCKVVSCEYQGGRYLLACNWNGYTIQAFARMKPLGDAVVLGVRMSDLTEYIDSVINKH